MASTRSTDTASLPFRAHAYGLEVLSDFALPGGSTGRNQPDVELRLAQNGQLPPFTPGLETCLYRMVENSTADGVTEFHRHGDWNCLRSTGYADFFFRDQRQITCFLDEHAPADMAVALFLGPVCAVLQELSGRPCLHASAVRIGDSALALAANSGTGKSSLTASFVNTGNSLVSDDILPLTIREGTCLATPGYSAMKLDHRVIAQQSNVPASTIRAVPGTNKYWVPVGDGWGSFAQAPVVLNSIYVLERCLQNNDDISIDSLRPGESLIELIRFSFCARFVERIGLQQARMGLLAEVVKHVRVRRCRYPSGLDHIARVRDAILGDFEKTSVNSRSSVEPKFGEIPLVHAKRFRHENLQDSHQE